MATDERNFRSAYYEKVGFRSVEEKKSLEILLKENPLDRQKLKQFCLRFTVPSAYRNLLWKALLDVTPRYHDNFEFVWQQRTETHKELLRALEVMQLVKPNTQKHIIFLLMWLLERGELKYDLQTQLDDPIFKGFLAISHSLVGMIEDDVDTFWIARGFYSLVAGFKDMMPRLTDATRSILEKEDPELYNHLISLAAFDVIRVDRWFYCLFSGVLHDLSLVKIWDKLLGGSFKIITFVAAVMLTTFRKSLLSASSGESLLVGLNDISDETSELICSKAIDLWQHHGSPLLAGDIRKDDPR